MNPIDYLLEHESDRDIAFDTNRDYFTFQDLHAIAPELPAEFIQINVQPVDKVYTSGENSQFSVAVDLTILMLNIFARLFLLILTTNELARKLKFVGSRMIYAHQRNYRKIKGMFEPDIYAIFNHCLMIAGLSA